MKFEKENREKQEFNLTFLRTEAFLVTVAGAASCLQIIILLKIILLDEYLALFHYAFSI